MNKENNKNINYEDGLLHLIPFDIGFMFYDVLTPSNKNNAIFGDKFIKKLIKKFGKKNVFNHKKQTKITKRVIDNNKSSGELLCYIKLLDDLYCYIFTSGIAIFVLGDFKKKALHNQIGKLKNCSLPILMNIQKKITNEALLSTKVKVSKNSKNGNTKFERIMDSQYKDVLYLERKTMHNFQDWCWSNAKTIAKGFGFKSVRPYTCNPEFKNYGFSYSMNIMISNKLSDEGVGYLLNGGAPKLDFKRDYWKKAIKHFNEIKNNCKPDKENIVYAGPYKMNFSWSSIIVTTDRKIGGLGDFISNDEQELETLLNAEMCIQARWFNADNCIENSIENQYSKIENLQTLQSFIEYSSAELENPTSSEMSSLYLQIRSKIIKTSRIQELYKSISDRMRSQKEIKLNLLRKRSNKLILVTDILLGCFTATGVFKTVYDIVTKDYKWWTLLILLGTVLLFISIQVWVYFAKKMGKD